MIAPERYPSHIFFVQDADLNAPSLGIAINCRSELIRLRITDTGPGVGWDQARNRGPRSLGPTTASR